MTATALLYTTFVKLSHVGVDFIIFAPEAIITGRSYFLVHKHSIVKKISLLLPLMTNPNPVCSSFPSSCQIWSSAQEGEGAHFGGYAAEHTEQRSAASPGHRAGRPAASFGGRPARPHGNMRVYS